MSLNEKHKKAMRSAWIRWVVGAIGLPIIYFAGKESAHWFWIPVFAIAVVWAVLGTVLLFATIHLSVDDDDQKTKEERDG